MQESRCTELMGENCDRIVKKLPWTISLWPHPKMQLVASKIKVSFLTHRLHFILET
jgi:hypothetical protein